MASKPGPKPGKEYEELHRARVKGTFVPADGQFEFMELDWAILEALPQQGEKVGKFLPKVMTAADVRKALGDNTLKASTIAGRLRWLRAAKYAEAIKVPSGRGWQRTPDGKRALDARKETS